MRYWVIGTFVSIIAVVSSVALLCDDALGLSTETADVDISLESGNNMTDTAYVGQEGMHLNVIWSENASSWEVNVSSPLFDSAPYGVTHTTREAGKSTKSYLGFDPEASPGLYNITAWVRYVDDGGTPKETRYDFQIKYIKAWRFNELRITSDDRLVAELETFVHFDKISTVFDTDGSLWVVPETVNMTDIPPGVHTFETDLRQNNAADRRDRDEVGYDIQGWVNGVHLWFWEKNIDPSTVEGGDDFNGSAPSINGVSVVFIIALVFILKRTVLRRKQRP
jgi:hypothetical protein